MAEEMWVSYNRVLSATSLMTKKLASAGEKVYTVGSVRITYNESYSKGGRNTAVRPHRIGPHRAAPPEHFPAGKSGAR